MEQNLEPCHRSMSILRERILKHISFSSKNVIFLDEIADVTFPNNPDEICDIVIFGGFIHRLLEMPMWPINRFRIWVISQFSKQAIINLYGIPSSYIGIIPRYKLFKINQKQYISQCAKIEKLVYSGRINQEKNFELVLYFAEFWQKNINSQVVLHIYGDFDNSLSNLSKVSDSNYNNKILSLVKKLKWKHSPIFHGWLDKKEWVKQIGPTALYINFSTYDKEDFNIGQAQVAEEGVFSILSNWAVHTEIPSNICCKIPPSLILSNDITMRDKAAMVAYLFKNYQPSTEDKDLVYFSSPNLCTQDIITQFKKNLFARYTYNLVYLLHHKVSFFYTKPGKEFLKTFIYSLENPQLLHKLYIIDFEYYCFLKIDPNAIYIEYNNISMRYHIRNSDEIYFVLSKDKYDKLSFFYASYLHGKKLIYGEHIVG